jgi:hypothetical protein
MKYKHSKEKQKEVLKKYSDGGGVKKEIQSKNFADLRRGDVIRRKDKLGETAIFVVNNSAKQSRLYKNEYDLLATCIVSNGSFYKPYEEYNITTIIKYRKLPNVDYLGTWKYEDKIDYSVYLPKTRKKYELGGSTGLPAGAEQHYVNHYLNEGASAGVFEQGGSLVDGYLTDPNFGDFQAGIYDNGGQIDTKNVTIAKRIKVKKWYLKTYPKDDLGKEIREDITFWSLWAYMSQGYDVYNILGVGDSMIRERVFEELSKILGVDYDVVYQKWLNSDEYAMGGSLGNHGLKQGDQIIKTMSGGVQKVKTKSGDIVYVNLANGYRGAEPPLPFKNGGAVKKNLSRDRKFVNYSQDYEVRYSKDKPKRHGYTKPKMSRTQFEDESFEFFADGGKIDKIKLGTPVSYKNDIWEVTQKKGIVGITNMKQGAWGSDFPFIPISKINIETELKDFYGKPIKRNQIPYLVEDFADGGLIGKEVTFMSQGEKDRGIIGEVNEDGSLAVDTGRSLRLVEKYEIVEIHDKPKKRGFFFADGGEIRRFNRHEQMDSETREEILDVVSEPNTPRGLVNYLYGLFDGYDYSKTANFKKEMEVLKSKDSRLHDRVIEIYKKIDNYKFEKQNNNYATGGVTKNYIDRNQLNTITIKKGDQKLTYKVSDVYNGAYKLEDGGNLEKMAFYVAKRNVVKVQLKNGKDVKVANGYWIKKGAKPIHTSKYDDGGQLEMKFAGGSLGSQYVLIKSIGNYGMGTVSFLVSKKELNKIPFDTIQEKAEAFVNNKEDNFGEKSYRFDKLITNSKEIDDYAKGYNHSNYKVVLSNDEENYPDGFYITKSKDYLKFKDGGQLEMKFAGGGKIETKIQKKVDEVNALIKKAIDSDGDPLMVVDTTGTWEEPMQYKPIVYKNGRLYIEYFEPYSGKTEKDVINKSNMDFDGYPTLLNIAKMYRKALKEKGISYAGGGDTKMVDGVMYEKVKFTNGIEDWYLSSDLHRVNFYCQENGLNPKNQKDFEKAYSVVKKYEGGGKTTFKEKATAIAKNFEGKKVKPKYQKEYGKTYDKAEAKEVGNKIAGSQKAKYDSKMSGGGKTKRGGAMVLAKQIRKEGESWASALKRANEQMRKK